MAKKRTNSASRGHLALNLQYVRTLYGWSQERLGLECELKRTYIGALERREVNPGIDNVDRIAQSLGVAGHLLIQDPADSHPVFFAMAKNADGNRSIAGKIDGKGDGNGRGLARGKDVGKIDGDGRDLLRGKRVGPSSF
jgi:transcriptional regulator with XRE-family HTH domain